MDEETLMALDAIVKNMEAISLNTVETAKTVKDLEKRIKTLETNAIPPSEMPGIRRGRL